MTKRITGSRHPAGFGLVVGLVALAFSSPALGQVVERNTTVTGPKGKSVERNVRTERRGNTVERSIDIQRPGGSYHRDVTAKIPSQNAPRPAPPGGPQLGQRSVIIQRDVIVQRPSPPPFLGGPTFAFSVGAVPPPFYYAPQPVYIPPPPPPVVVYNPPVRYAPPPPPAEVVIDPVADAIGRLRSLHSNSRREGAITLGKLGDARGVGPLIDRLKNDHEKEVRMASAWALAEIGDPRAIISLETAAQFDKKSEVRAVATKSLARMPTEIASTDPAAARASTRSPNRSKPDADNPPEPRYNLDDLPPPDPTPRSSRSPR